MSHRKPRLTQRIVAACTLLAMGVVLSVGPLALAAPPEGKGNGNNGNQGNNGNGNGNAGGGQGRGAGRETGGGSSAATQRSEQATRGANRPERQHPHQERRALGIPDRGQANGRFQVSQAIPGAGGFGGRPAHAAGGQGLGKGPVEDLLKSLNKFEHSRWDYNPNDTRGQGNMGKPDMRTPYGFDKDSGREGADRGRPIHPEPVLDLASLVTVDFMTTNWYLDLLNKYLAYYQALAATDPRTTWYASYVSWLQYALANYATIYPYDPIRVNMTDTINYTLNLGTVDGFDGTTLLVTTTLTSLNDYTGYTWTYDRATRTWTNVPTMHYDAGQVVVSDTQEITVGEDSTFTYSYDPPADMTSWSGNQFQLAVTVTEPESGTSYSLTYDRSLYLYRCPYGIVYDKKTGKPVPGATVTVHNVDGSMVALDKATNPNVSNPQVTDATGRYNCKLGVGKKYYLTVKAPGYEEHRSPLFSEQWHIVREDVSLTPSTLLSQK